MNTEERVKNTLEHVRIMRKSAHKDAERQFKTSEDYAYYRGKEDAFSDVILMLESIVEAKE